MIAQLQHPLVTPERLAKSAYIYLRQSTVVQKEENWGSAAAQRQQVELAVAFGWPRESITLIDDDLGKSGKTTEGRVGLERICSEVMADRVGAVFAMNVARLARTLIDFERLRLLCALHDVVLFVDNRPADPRDPFDTVILQIHGALAQQNNADRAKTFRDARYAKARSGEIVSVLPIGWVRSSDGSFDFDPQVKPTFDRVYQIFREKGSIRQTVKFLNEAGIKFPSRHKGKLHWGQATIAKVRPLLVNPAYAGTYIFGRTELRPDPKRRGDGGSVQVPVAKERWIVRHNVLPAYTTLSDQAEFREMMRRVGFRVRNRPGRGVALCQGMIRCVCGSTLTVTDPQIRPGRALLPVYVAIRDLRRRVLYVFPRSRL